ncbi:MAG: hypothetical protein L0Z62_06025 [Gemmataceae bacterium]|nr:hypothetical protein [Gemmataceae bacterium]
MKKGPSWRGTSLLGALLLFGAVGCGINEQDLRVTQTFDTLKEVTDTFGEVRKHLTDAVTNAGKDEIKQNNPDLIKAQAAAEKLARFGEKLQRIKELTDRLEDRTSPEYRKELADRYRVRLRDGLVSLIEEEGKVKVAFQKAEEHSTKAAREELLEPIRSDLRKGREAFEVLTKQR